MVTIIPTTKVRFFFVTTKKSKSFFKLFGGFG